MSVLDIKEIDRFHTLRNGTQPKPQTWMIVTSGLIPLSGVDDRQTYRLRHAKLRKPRFAKAQLPAERARRFFENRS